MDINKLSQSDLKQIATQIGIKARKSKKDTIASLVSYFKSLDMNDLPQDSKKDPSSPVPSEHSQTKDLTDNSETDSVSPIQKTKKTKRQTDNKKESTCLVKDDTSIPYVKIESINGSGGKPGSCFKVKKGRGHKVFVMKVYKPNKSTSTIEGEIQLQNLASKKKLAPAIRDGNMEHKYIIMDMLDKSLKTVLVTNGGLDKHQQKDIIALHQGLDKVGVFHGSPKLTNYMYKENTPYIVDFGLAKPITAKLCEKLNTETPNETVMTAGLIINLKKENYPASSYDVLLKSLSKKDRAQYNLLQ
jgi:hypothetical protein